MYQPSDLRRVRLRENPWSRNHTIYGVGVVLETSVPSKFRDGRKTVSTRVLVSQKGSTSTPGRENALKAINAGLAYAILVDPKSVKKFRD